MAVNYEKHNFIDGMVLSAEHLNSIEDGICETCEQINENTLKAEQVQREIENLKYLFLFKDGYFRNNINDNTQKLTLWDLFGYVPTVDQLKEFISRHNIYYVYDTSSYIEIVPLYININASADERAYISALAPYNRHNIYGWIYYNSQKNMSSTVYISETINNTASVSTNRYNRQITINQFGGNSITFYSAGQLVGQSWLFTDYESSSITGDYTAMFGFNNTCFGNGNIIGGIKNNITGRAICAVGEKNLVSQCATGAIVGGTYGHVNNAGTVIAIGNGTSSKYSNFLDIRNDGTIIISPSDKETITITYDRLLELFQ